MKQSFTLISGFKYLLIVFVFAIPNKNTNAQTWSNVGIAGYSAGTAPWQSIAIDGSGTPYVTYVDCANGWKVTVKKYNGSSWVTVGIVGFSADTINYPVIAIDGSGTPYVVYEDYGNSHKATVMKYNGSSWVSVGSAGLSTAATTRTTLAIDGSGTPYVAYQDVATSPSNKITVKKYNGSSWVNVGAPGFSGGSFSNGYNRWIAIDASGTPYVAYQDYSTTPVYKATVMKYNGSSWVTVGSAGFSTGAVGNVSLAIDPSGTPYVAYGDAALANRATVMKYSGSWVTVGTAGFSGAAAGFTSIAIDGSGTPYVGYSDAGATIFNGATVKKFDGSSWVTVGTTGFSAGQVIETSLAINGSGIPYITYMDVANGNKASTKKFNPPPSAITGVGTVCVGATTTLSDATTGGVWSSSATIIATVGSSGIVTGMSGGTAIISYTTIGGAAILTVTVTPMPSAGTITGAATVCALSSISLTDAVLGGTWSSSNTSIASVGGTGSVTGVSTGTATISYSVTNSCGTAVATKIVTVNPLPYAGTISGIATVCVSSATSLTDVISGGVWSSSNTSVATVGSAGNVTGVSSGSATISYTVTNSCGSASATYSITVNPLPDAGSITGMSTVCVGNAIPLTDVASGGVWSSSNTAVGTIGSTGIITGISIGTTIISYIVSNGCGSASATYSVTVNPLPDAGSITGTSTVCEGSSITFTDPITGGVWSSSTTSSATVGGTGIVTGMLSGTAIISYTITNSCGIANAIFAITVNPLPDAGTIIGSSTVCETDSIMLLNSITGGTWSSSNSNATASSSGVITGITAGTSTISYTVTNSCGSVSAISTITIIASSSCPTSVNTINKENEAVRIYPNPSNGLISIELLYLVTADIEITDILGRVIMSKSIQGKEIFDLTNNAEGVYYVKIRSFNYSQICKISLQK